MFLVKNEEIMDQVEQMNKFQFLHQLKLNHKQNSIVNLDKYQPLLHQYKIILDDYVVFVVIFFKCAIKSDTKYCIQERKNEKIHK